MANTRLGISPGTAYTLIVAWAVIVLALGVGMAAVASADNAGDELANETVNLTNETEPITVGVEWNETITDETNETADITFYNASEYESDPANATAVISDSVYADAGNTSEVDYGESDGLVNGTQYRVVVTGTDAEIDDAWISTANSGGALFGGSSSGGALVGGVAVIAVVAIAIYGRGSE